MRAAGSGRFREVGPGAPVPDSAGGDDHNDDIHGPEVVDTCTSLGGGPGPVVASTPIDSGWAIVPVAGEGASAHEGPTALAGAETRARAAEAELPEVQVAMLDLEGPVAHCQCQWQAGADSASEPEGGSGKGNLTANLKGRASKANLKGRGHKR